MIFFSKEYGSEFGSQMNSDMNGQSHDLLSESSKKSKKNLQALKEASLTPDASFGANSKKSFKIQKTKSIDVRDMEEVDSSSDGVRSENSEKQRAPKIGKSKPTRSIDESSDVTSSAASAKIVKPSGPSKWSQMREKIKQDQAKNGFTVNAHDL